MTPPRATSADTTPAQQPEQIALAIESYLAEHPRTVLFEDGAVAFDFGQTKFSLSTEHGKCTLHLWSDERNLVRRVIAVTERAGSLRLMVQKFGQAKPQTLELVGEADRRTPTARDAARKQYLRTLERVLLRSFPEWKIAGLQTAMDLERSFGPAYARGVLQRGQQAWALIAVNPQESSQTIDGVLTLGILWLQLCRERSEGKRLVQGLRIIVPTRSAALTLARMFWLNSRAAKWELYELDIRTEELTERDAADHGNLTTHLLHAPNEDAVRERLTDGIARVMQMVPESARSKVELRAKSGAELAFALHGLEFARIKASASANSFGHDLQITFGAGGSETELTAESEGTLRYLVAQLCARRKVTGSAKDALYRMQPERWLESILRQNIQSLDRKLIPAPVYAQVPVFAASDRGMLDLLAFTEDRRLALLELKADEDLHFALQGLDYWIRARWHQKHFQAHGYFPGMQLSEQLPVLYLVAPSLRVHPATEVVLRHLKPEVEWQIIGVNESWRKGVEMVYRRRSSDPLS